MLLLYFTNIVYNFGIFKRNFAFSCMNKLYNTIAFFLHANEYLVNRLAWNRFYEAAQTVGKLR